MLLQSRMTFLYASYIHLQFEKRAANVLSQYHLNKGKHNWEKFKFHIFEDQSTPHQDIEEEIESLKNDLQECRAAKSNLEAEKKRFFLRK